VKLAGLPEEVSQGRYNSMSAELMFFGLLFPLLKSVKLQKRLKAFLPHFHQRGQTRRDVH
jgi:hypothetical protein